MNGRIDTPQEVLELIETEMENLERELSKHPHIRHDVDLSFIGNELKSEFIHQLVKSGEDYKMRIPVRMLAKDKLLRVKLGLVDEDWQQEQNDRRLQWLKFKNFYLRWAKNLLAELNKAKMLNKWVWFDIKKLAICLTAVKLEEDLLEGF